MDSEADLASLAAKASDDILSICVFGASGDLAKKKVYPAIFALFYEGHLPEDFVVFGYARSGMTTAEFTDKIRSSLPCRISAKGDCSEHVEKFLERCSYQAGQYDDPEDFKKLAVAMKEKEGSKKAMRVFYLSIPPSIFVPVAQNAARHVSSDSGETRVIVEKPFGRDLQSSRELTAALAADLAEENTYRIDHYLGKELIENITVLRFSNIIFSPLWSRAHIRNVQICFSENFGTEGRGGYFDNYGIIRDVIQNHLLQVMALFAMEEPASLDAEDIRDEKVKVIRSIRPIDMANVVLGQYKGANKLPGYLDDETVPPGSRCPTFAAMALFNNPRFREYWSSPNVPRDPETGKETVTELGSDVDGIRAYFLARSWTPFRLPVFLLGSLFGARRERMRRNATDKSEDVIAFWATIVDRYAFRLILFWTLAASFSLAYAESKPVRLVSEFFLLYPAAHVVFGLTVAGDASRTYRFLTHPLLLLGGRVSYAAYLLQFPVWTYIDRMAYGTFKNRFPPCSRHDPEAAASWTDCFAKSGYQEWPDVMVVWNVFLLFAVAYVVNRYYETRMVAFLARKLLPPDGSQKAKRTPADDDASGAAKP